MKYYIHDGEKKHGPFSLDELKEKLITKNTPVWYEGLQDWTSAGSVDELKLLFSSTPPDFKKSNPLSTSKSQIGRFILIALLLVFIVAWTTNPSVDQHRAKVSGQLIEKLDQLKDDLKTEKKFLKFLKEIAFAFSSGALHEQVYERISTENYIVCSFTKVRLKNRSVTVGVGAFGEVWLFTDALNGIRAQELIE